jgi:hypothetical protein
MTESRDEPERDEVPEGAEREEQAQRGRLRHPVTEARLEDEGRAHGAG